MRPAMQYVLHNLIKHILLYVEPKFQFSAACESYMHGNAFMMHDKSCNSQSPLQHITSNQNCPKAIAVTTQIIMHFSFSALVYLYSSPRLPAIRYHPVGVGAQPPGAHWALSWMVVLEWVSTPGPFQRHWKPTCMCAHIHDTLLIPPPVLLSISVHSGAVEVDGCWQGPDCGGKDDGSSCRDRTAVSWDLLAGVIRLLWNLPPIRSKREDIAKMHYRIQVLTLCFPPMTSSYLHLQFILLHTHISPEGLNTYTQVFQSA